ncbi:F0F1 ATP synthase subunit B [Streptomyces monashensis]|uniref:ATP synthase subunit b n=1 Tax=Streptomyces monashensis TaxID=1678012 RepID=A0A1S2QQJ3_9ACTN|nr:F0F1 ATP synthase subunit B [Streptomyces monashensis]OIK07685.1 ATP synthase F0 subunit B [Streptomyces monashensis]
MGILIPGLAPSLVCVLTFAVIFACLSKILLPRINNVLAERRDAIEGQRELAERTTIEAGEVLAEYREELADARHEAARLRQEALEQGARLIAETRAEALREREAMTTEAQARIAADRALAKTELHGAVVSLATELAGRVIGEPIDSVVRESDVVDRFFSDLDDRSTAGLQ